MRFKDKVAFITGGGRGIGETYARALAAEGAAVALAEIDLPAAQAVAASIEDTGARAIAVACDVADQSSVDAAVAHTVEHLGGVDILINNAAKHLMEYAGKPTELPRAKWRLMLDVNVIGIVNCAAACRPSMRERGGGVCLRDGVEQVDGEAGTGWCGSRHGSVPVSAGGGRDAVGPARLQAADHAAERGSRRGAARGRL